MLVGIMSDSHGDATMTAGAIALLEERGALRIFHCGDICQEGVLDEFAGHDVVFVWGNCDSPTAALRKYVERLELQWPEPPVRIEIAGKHIALIHGHEWNSSGATSGNGLDYLLYGHTHHPADQYEGECRIINPGALHRADIHTVALLDLATDALSFLNVETGEQVEVPTLGQAPARSREGF